MLARAKGASRARPRLTITARAGPLELPRDTEGLPEAGTTELVELADGDEFELDIIPVKKQIGDATVRMLTYNGSVPGPTLKVPQGATITVHVTNHGDLEATVHWHGLRLENLYDGTHDTQAPIPVGETFTYQVHVPDAGAYWYHPHIREDYGQELGLYGNILVTPSEADYWPPANRELPVTLDDILIEEGQIAAFRERRRRTWRWVASATSCSSQASQTCRSKRSAARSSASTSRTLRIRASSTSRCRGADEARRRRRRPLRARGARRGGVARSLRARRRRRALPDAGDSSSSTGRPSAPTGSPLSPSPTSSRSPRCRRVRSFGRTPTWSSYATRSSRTSKAPPDKTLSFVAEMDMGVPEGVGRLRLPDAPGGGERGARQLPEVWDEAGRAGSRRDDLRLPDASGSNERQARTLS